MFVLPPVIVVIKVDPLPILTPVLEIVAKFHAPERASTLVHNTLPLH